MKIWKVWLFTVVILLVWGIVVLMEHPPKYKRFFGREHTWTDR